MTPHHSLFFENVVWYFHAMNEAEGVRFDKWLWAVRLYKTRALAATACKLGHVTVDGQPVKPARDIRLGETIQAKTGEITRTVKVLQLLGNRVGAARVKEFAEDLTPASEYEKQREIKLAPLFHRPKGSGRPTKKERRELDKLL
jgi:ribosome-associated heat shock protein Hsp15